MGPWILTASDEKLLGPFLHRSRTLCHKGADFAGRASSAPRDRGDHADGFGIGDKERGQKPNQRAKHEESKEEKHGGALDLSSDPQADGLERGWQWQPCTAVLDTRRLTAGISI